MQPEAWRNVLVVRPDNIGDVVLAGPFLRALRDAAPAARLTLLASPGGSEAAPLLAPWIDHVVVEQVLWQDVFDRLPHDPARELALVERIREQRFDAAFFLTSFSQSPLPPAYVCYLAAVPVRVGQAVEHGGGLLTHPVPPAAWATHQAERNLHLLDALGIPVPSRELQVAVPAEANEAVAELLALSAVRGRFALLLPGASADARRYPLERVADVARALAAMDRAVVLAGSERERDALAPVLAAPVVSLVGRTNVPQLAALVARAAVVVANNSLGLHLADALRRPVVATYSGTDLVEQWRPRSAEAHVLRREVACSPCYAFECPYGKECLDVPAEEVARAALRLAGPGSPEAARAEERTAA